MLRAEHNINERIARTDEHNILNKVIDAERSYDFISIIFKEETPIYKGKPYEDSTAICFHYIKLIHVNVNLGLKASQFDLMKDLYDYECLRLQTSYRCSRLRTEFECAKLPNDSIPDDEKLLGLIKHKVKNPQTREQFDQ
ncbi:19304_t:CDS:2 [Cetraspora pellucida]|uniref:19304_t:CDS:1 n=1 Tax=Cetraspora pellucida TaxID=1433469 RepID=A0A9N9BEI5_9GLOM|nr:19304_t:CDS:2 [Cetraspora pellucida]